MSIDFIYCLKNEKLYFSCHTFAECSNDVNIYGLFIFIWKKKKRKHIYDGSENEKDHARMW